MQICTMQHTRLTPASWAQTPAAALLMTKGHYLVSLPQLLLLEKEVTLQRSRFLNALLHFEAVSLGCLHAEPDELS